MPVDRVVINLLFVYLFTVWGRDFFFFKDGSEFMYCICLSKINGLFGSLKKEGE